MNPRLPISILLLLFIAKEASGEPVIPEFSGYLSLGKQRLFVLTCAQTQESSGWMTIGSAFQGFTIEDFDPKSDVLVLLHGAQSTRIPLKASRVVAAQSKPRPRTTSSHVDGGSELRMTLSSDRVLSLRGHAFPGETLDALFTVMAREKEGLLLIIEKQYPKEVDSNRDAELLKSLMARMRAAGLKRGAIKMTHTRDDDLTK